jgi:hypothetical protein
VSSLCAVSCYHNNIIPPDRTIVGAELRLRGTRFFGSTPLVNGTFIVVDMVSAAMLVRLIAHHR